MSDFIVPLPELFAGMARCVRESILPSLTDPAARIQAETLASLLAELADPKRAGDAERYFEEMTSKEGALRSKG